MDNDSELRRAPLAWTLKAVLVGCAAGLGMTKLVHPGLHGHASTSMAIGVIFSLVMWGGFELFHQPFERLQLKWSPAQVGLAAVAWMLVLYTLLLALVVLLVRLLTGVDFLESRVALATSGIFGLAISGIIATKEAVARAVEGERKLARAEARALFLALKAQLHPHTLFNALNTIAALIPEDPRGAEEATLRLSALLRNILDALEKPEWPLADEFRLLEDLLRLEELRFGERLGFTLDLAPAMADRPVQPLILLPLVENALKHGFRPKVGPCFLKVTARDGRVAVEDDGVGRDPASPEGVGLRTVRERLEAGGGALRFPDVASGCRVEVTL